MLPRELPLSSLVGSTNRIIVNRYQVCKKIGNGTFGTVYLVEDNVKSKEKKVLKEICIGDMSEPETQSVDREANLLSKLNHHNIVRMFESFVNEESFYIVMEFCEMGDLDRELKKWKSRGEKVPHNQTMDWFVQLVIAVQYIHSQRMLHRDLKCKNVFLTNNKTVKIGDFGISRILTSTEYASTFTGTPYYMSPEVIKHDGYGSKSDIWSLGVILYEICELKRAFEGKNLMSVMMKIIQGNIPTISVDRGELGAIFKKMLCSNPHDRPSSSQLLSEPLISAHLSSLRKRLHNDQKRDRNVSSASSSTSHDSSNRKMTARERMRLEKQKRADEEAEQLRYLASENLAANRARTAARKERELNRPNFIKQNTPSLEIKAINPSVIKHDRDFRYSPKSQSPKPKRPMTAIHPEPRKRLSSPKIRKNEYEKQLEAINKSLEYAKAESLSKAICRENQGEVTPTEVDGNMPDPIRAVLSHQEKLESSSNSSSDSIVDIFTDQLNTERTLFNRTDKSAENLSADLENARADLAATGASMPTDITLSSSSSSCEEELFQTANDVCVLDVDDLELTSVSQIPEDPDEANTYYSLEAFEDMLSTPLEEPSTPDFSNNNVNKIFSKSSSLDLKSRSNRNSNSFLNRSLPLNSTTRNSESLEFRRSDSEKFLNLSDISDLNISGISDSDYKLNISSISHDQLNISNISNTSNVSDYTKSSTIILRSDRIRTLKRKCEDRLGHDLFVKIYCYLNDARFGDDVVPEDIIVQTLKDWVPQLTSDCFLVDQLIYLEKQEMLASEMLDL